MRLSPLIVLTGGPGGGKTMLIDELSRDPAWAGRFSALPEAVFALRHSNIPPKEKLFQRIMVQMQWAMEDSLSGALKQNRRIILCNRGSLDPLAYWLARGWEASEFFPFTGTRREDHYQRYTAVIHLVTAADGAPEAYQRWPEAHRPESAEEAVQLDRLLQQVWEPHPCYVRIDNDGNDWPTKSRKAREILARLAVELAAW